MRAKDGVPFSFNLTTNGNNQRRVDIAQVVENQWARIGVDANIQTLEFNTFIDNLIGKNYEAGLAGWWWAAAAASMRSAGPSRPPRSATSSTARRAMPASPRWPNACGGSAATSPGE